MIHTCAVRCRGVIMHDGKLLVIQNAGRSFYAFPGGHLDPGEDPQTCMKRELLEELGMEPVIGRLLCVYTFTNAEGMQSIEFYFEVQNGSDFLDHEQYTKSHAHEIAEVRWIAPHETTLDLLPKALHQAFLEGRLLAESVLFLKD